ncbi:hypothetical protein [Xenorhabdus griffiniae]|uniref:phage tail fiber protein n=1 Tax=Xenorhabdus griffiniae TaxID=351672 RepID=UPI002359BB09|nr:hypothetical protein [Xenorhabdus griffiniae]MDC9607234.1 hypothetical protein [Xenorhabdus griffiniae]
MEHKLGIGHYQISGVLGYNADGAWSVHGGISSPKNKRIKDIIDGEKVYYADAEPCDIPEGCRLDVCVQMQEDVEFEAEGGRGCR